MSMSRRFQRTLVVVNFGAVGYAVHEFKDAEYQFIPPVGFRMVAESHEAPPRG